MSGWLKLSGLVVFTSYRHTHSTPLLLLLPPAPFILLGPDNHNDIKWHRSTMISHLKNNGMTLYWPDLVSHSDTAGCHWLTSKENEHFFPPWQPLFDVTFPTSWVLLKRDTKRFDFRKMPAFIQIPPWTPPFEREKSCFCRRHTQTTIR